MRRELDHPTLSLGIVTAQHVAYAPSAPELLAELSALEQAIAADSTRYPESVRTAVRDVLRKGGYKPTGRGKPASEYLLGQAQAGALPRICNLVDICNLVSLRSGLPISVFDDELLGDDPCLRFGRPGEQYVFNVSGQTMDIAGLPVVCRGALEPVGNAVRDSMRCKVHPQTERVRYVVYGSTLLAPALLEDATRQLTSALSRYAQATGLTVVVPTT